MENIKTYVFSTTTRGLATLSPLEDLTQKFNWDSHFVLYRVENEPEIPRLTKSWCYDHPEVFEKVSVRLTALDYDLPGGHEGVRAGRVEEEFFELFFLDHPLLAPRLWYLTRGGVRIIYEHDPLAPAQAEHLHRLLTEKFMAQGVIMDATVWEWNRLHRAPNVIRDGQEYSPTLHWGPVTDLSPYDLTDPTPVFNVPSFDSPQPTPEEAREILWEPAADRGERATPWGRWAKGRLKNRLEGEMTLCFQMHPPPLPDPRNPTLCSMIGCAISLLSGQMGTTPRHIYGLLYERTVQSLRPDGRDLAAELWKMIGYCWNKEIAKESFREESVQQAQAKLLEAVPEATDLARVLDRLIVRVCRGVYYVMQSDGFYSNISACRDTLRNNMQRSGLVGPDKVVSLRKVTNQGERDMTAQEIINDHTLCVSPDIRLKPGYPPNKGWLEGDHLCFGSYSRNPDLEPEYSDAVDTWLKLFFGDYYNDACKWIGLSLAFERGPICALSLTSGPGTGKGMLVSGLSEATIPGTVATAAVFGDWQYAIKTTPWIVVDEGWPEKTKDLSKTFRLLVGGGAFTVETKYAHQEVVNANPRVVFTANNRTTIEKLFMAQGLTQEDVDAICQRVFHCDLGPDAAEYLQARGGFRFTGGWVANLATGTESKFTLAKHFLWLYEKHKDDEAPGRFLMQDMTDPTLVEALTLRSPHVSVMAATLAKVQELGLFEKGAWTSIRTVKSIHDSHGISRNDYTLADIDTHLRLFVKEEEFGDIRIDMKKLKIYTNKAGAPQAKARKIY